MHIAATIGELELVGESGGARRCLIGTCRNRSRAGTSIPRAFDAVQT
jgi:hypothetical protein